MVEPPIWRICSSNWIISPGFRGENKKYLKPPSNMTRKKKHEWRCISYQTWWFSIAMLVFGGNVWNYEDQSKHGINLATQRNHSFEKKRIPLNVPQCPLNPLVTKGETIELYTNSGEYKCSHIVVPFISSYSRSWGCGSRVVQQPESESTYDSQKKQPNHSSQRNIYEIMKRKNLCVSIRFDLWY